MNILFITPSFLPRIGGVETHIKEVSGELALDGHNITILVVERAGHAAYEENGRVRVFRLDKKKRLGRAYILYQMLKAWRVFKEADIIHFHDFLVFWKYGTWLLPTLRLLRKKVYLTFHGWEGKCPPEKNAVFKRKVCEKLVDGNMCIGHFIEKWYGTRASVVSYGGVRKAEGPGECLDHVVFVGRLSEDTGITEYVKAWKEIGDRHRELKLVICGDGDLRRSLEDLVEREGIRNVEFKGFVKDPLSYIKNARIVFTSGYLGILESFSYRKPVISIYSNQLKKDYLEMMPESKGMLWIAGDSSQIASSVLDALSDGGRKASKAYEFSIRRSWEAVKRDYYSLWGIDGGKAV